MNPRSGFGMAQLSTCQGGWRWPGLAMRVLLTSCCAILAVQPCPHTLGRRETRPLGSCRLLEPLPAHGAQNSSRPEADPQLILPQWHSSQKRTHPNHMKNDQTRPNTRAAKNEQKQLKAITQNPSRPKAIKNDRHRSNKWSSLPWPNRRAIASHHTAPLRPTTRMAAGQCSQLQLRA